MHGGEVTSNATGRTSDVIEKVCLCYDTTHGPAPYYLPYRRLTQEGTLGQVYHLHCHFHDYKVPYADNFSRDFTKEALAKMQLVYQRHGVLVLALHPVYFGFFSYVMQPKNFYRFVSFLSVYLTRVFKIKKGKRFHQQTSA